MNAVTVCIPAYRAEAFLGATIESALAQTYPAVRIVVSVDPGGDNTVGAATRYLKSGRVRVIEQGTRLGWVGNINAALSRAESPYAMVLPHDDSIEPTYIAECVAALDARPGAVLAYSDLDFGKRSEIAEESVTGDQPARIETFLRSHFDAVAFRGVFDRRRVLRRVVPAFALANYAADTLWIGQVLAQGEMVRVPQVLYRKHLLKSSVHAAWRSTTTEEMEEMWIVHCCEVDRTLREAGVVWDERLEAAWEARLLHGRNNGTAPPPQALDPSAPLRAQAGAIFAIARERQPHYSWAAGR